MYTQRVIDLTANLISIILLLPCAFHMFRFKIFSKRGLDKYEIVLTSFSIMH